ncbi:Uncharacterized conserved protein [Phaffia rhodozyma]|uniref:peptidyl-tRNA hydrolase n=1 Tax=Phaffia rhodozyma TaxID=264483 RepID=A0A0F7SWL1_PHARH|nr:Uncharacterized conserved protein [Phaffia rhodozyma]
MAQTSSIVATALLSLTLGYWIGVGNSLSFQRDRSVSSAPENDEVVGSAKPKEGTTPSSNDEDESKLRQVTIEQEEEIVESDDEEDDESEDESEDEDRPLEGLNTVQAGFMEECKMVLVVRTDLKMTKGKIAAQCGHATLACYRTLLASNPTLLKHWERTGQAKIALQVNSEDELLLLQAVAQSLNVCARDICDAGRTQIAAGSRTVLGVGPAPVSLINQSFSRTSSSSIVTHDPSVLDDTLTLPSTTLDSSAHHFHSFSAVRRKLDFRATIGTDDSSSEEETERCASPLSARNERTSRMQKTSVMLVDPASTVASPLDSLPTASRTSQPIGLSKTVGYAHTRNNSSTSTLRTFQSIRPRSSSKLGTDRSNGLSDITFGTGFNAPSPPATSSPSMHASSSTSDLAFNLREQLSPTGPPSPKRSRSSSVATVVEDKENMLASSLPPSFRSRRTSPRPVFLPSSSSTSYMSGSCPKPQQIQRLIGPSPGKPVGSGFRDSQMGSPESQQIEMSFEDAKPSPDAFKVSLVKKGQDGSAKKSMQRSPLTPNPKINFQRKFSSSSLPSPKFNEFPFFSDEASPQPTRRTINPLSHSCSKPSTSSNLVHSSSVLSTDHPRVKHLSASWSGLATRAEGQETDIDDSPHLHRGPSFEEAILNDFRLRSPVRRTDLFPSSSSASSFSSVTSTPFRPSRLFFPNSPAAGEFSTALNSSSGDSASSSPLRPSHGCRTTQPVIIDRSDSESNPDSLVGLGFNFPISTFGTPDVSSPTSASFISGGGDGGKRLKRKGEAVMDAPRLPSRAAFEFAQPTLTCVSLTSESPTSNFQSSGDEREQGGHQRPGMARRPKLQRAMVNLFEKRFECVDKLGQGNGGVVWSVRERETGTEGAVKISTIFSGLRDRIRHAEELDILRSISSNIEPHHPNILPLHAGWEENGRLYLHTPLFQSGDLSTFLASLVYTPSGSSFVPFVHQTTNSTGGLDESRAWKLLASLASALAHVHSMDIIHLDIKPSNVLIDGEGEVVLADWGHSTRWPRIAPREILKGSNLAGWESMDEPAAGPAMGSSGGGAFGFSEVSPSRTELMDWEREGDRDYLSAEGVRGIVGKEGDIFSLGLLMLEAITNIVPPTCGDPWHRLRTDDFSDLEDSLGLSHVPSPSGFPSTRLFHTFSTFTSTSDDSMHTLDSVPLVTPGASYFPSTFLDVDQMKPSLMGTPLDAKSWGSEPMVALVKQMMASDPSVRPTAGGLLSHFVVRSAKDLMDAGRKERAGSTEPGTPFLFKQPSFSGYVNGMTIAAAAPPHSGWSFDRASPSINSPVLLSSAGPSLIPEPETFLACVLGRQPNRTGSFIPAQVLTSFSGVRIRDPSREIDLIDDEDDDEGTREGRSGMQVDK